MTSQLINSLFFATPTIHVAKKQLDYPLYGADFDPLNHHFLLVGGGGGTSSTGVANKITLLDASNRSELKEISELLIPPEEDSVASLKIADSDPLSLLAYAGVNSSQQDQKAGKNEHFRSFRVPVPARRRKGSDETAVKTLMVEPVQSLSRASLFRAATGLKNECYQRVIKVSPPIVDESIPAGREGLEPSTRKLKKRLVSIASGLAAQNEVVTFPTSETPSRNDVLSRTNLEKAEANDVDLTNTDNTGSSFALAYCTDNNLYLQQFVGEKLARTAEPIPVYETSTGPQGRSKIRALSWLTPRYLLLLQNRVNRSGVELVVLKVSKDYAQVSQVLVKYVKNMKQAVGLDTCTLSEGEDGSQQFVIAVAGQDSSLQVHTLDYVSGKGITPFRQFADLVELHNGPITKVVFSNFIPPTAPISGSTAPQYIRLATVGVDKQVIVQTLPLSPTPTTGTGKTNPRYVLNAPTQYGVMLYSFFMGLSVLILGLTIVLAYLELTGAIPPIVGTTKYLPRRWQDSYARSHAHQHAPGPVIPESMPPAAQSIIDKIKLSEATPIIEKLEEISDRVKLADATSIIEQMQSMQSAIPSKEQLQNAVPSVEEIQSAIPSVEDIKNAVPSVEEVQDKLVDLVSQQSEDAGKYKGIIVRDLEHLGGEVSAELRHEAEIVKEGTLKKWEHLTQKEQRTWKQKLKDAGQWTEKQGETVLKGVFFGQLGALVGEAIRG